MNLVLYGLDPTAVSAALQRRVQASSVLNPIPGSKEKVVVQIQGNQVQHVGKLLLGWQTSNHNSSNTVLYGLLYFSNKCKLIFLLCTDYYQIPHKYIQGLDKATKPGKKK